MLYRNYDHQFVTQLERAQAVRKIAISIQVSVVNGRLKIVCSDEDKNQVEVVSADSFDKANNPQQRERLMQQLEKCGDSDYTCREISYEGDEVLFVPAAAANALRRIVLESLEQKRAEHREILELGRENRQAVYTGKGDWHLNVVNQNSALFYQEHGVQQVEYGFEKQYPGRGADLMHTRYCILHELGRCRKKNGNADLQFPLFLYNDKQLFQLEFDCQACEMRIRTL